MKTAARITLTLAGITALAAIWQPIGAWWQWAITALLFLLIGAGLAGTADRTTKHDDYEDIPNSITYSSNTPIHLRDGETLSSTGDEVLDEALERRPNYGKRRDER